MKRMMLATLSGLAIAPAAALAQPTTPPAAAATAAPQKQFVPGIAVANLPEAVAASNAFINAAKERQIVYKTQIAMAQSRSSQLNAQLAPLVEKFNRDRQAGNVAQADLQQQAQTIQSLQQSGQQEVNTILAPVALSEAYVSEQISDVVNRAITGAMDRRGITMVVTPQNILAFNNAYNMNAAIVAELNTLLPVAKVAPPAGWQPRAVREAQAAQQTQAAIPARPATTKH